MKLSEDNNINKIYDNINLNSGISIDEESNKKFKNLNEIDILQFSLEFNTYIYYCNMDIYLSKYSKFDIFKTRKYFWKHMKRDNWSPEKKYSNEFDFYCLMYKYYN